MSLQKNLMWFFKNLKTIFPVTAAFRFVTFWKWWLKKY